MPASPPHQRRDWITDIKEKAAAAGMNPLVTRVVAVLACRESELPKVFAAFGEPPLTVAGLGTARADILARDPLTDFWYFERHEHPIRAYVAYLYEVGCSRETVKQAVRMLRRRLHAKA